MLSHALECAKRKGVSVEVKKVPGAYEIPFAVKQFLKEKDIDAVATLGTVIQGETHHDIIIMQAIAKALLALSLQYDKPVSLGVSGPRITEEQAKARIKEYAERAVETALR